MFRRAWWTRRRIVVAAVLSVLVAGAIVWECGTEEVREGQPLDEARAALQRAGAVDQSAVCGMSTSLGGRKPTNVSCSMWEFPDGHTLYLVATRDSDDEPFRVSGFDQWKGWYKSGGVELPDTVSVRLRRSVLAVVPSWMR